MFNYLVQTAKDTNWGQRFDYTSIKTFSDYQNRFPVQDYDFFKTEIERIMKGEDNVLWPGTTSWFAKSSGTTSDKSKFIPVTKVSLDDCHFKGSRDLLAMYLTNQPESNLFAGKGLVMGGSHQVNQLNEYSRFGDVSAVMMQNLPIFAHLVKTPNLSIALMSEWEEKIEKMAQHTVKQNVTHIAGVPTWTIVLIRRLFEITGKNNLRDVWPNLELYIHGGVSFKPYREQFNQLIRGDDMNYIETYNASEGFFAFQDRLKADDMLLILDNGIFYEFIPVEEFDKEFPRTISLAEVEVGKNYGLVISTNAGLWRYKVGDTIRFTSTHPFRVQVSGRIKHFINAFGEEVIVDNSDEAVRKACLATGAIIKDYTAAPIYFSGEGKGGHEWIIEFDKQPNDIKIFTEVLDNTLQSINSDYEAKRYKNIALELPVIHIAPQGTFYNWLKSRGKLGGQHKVPRLSNERNYIEEILAMLPK
ncbi:MAG: GH3 auxin-responsive promoter family protein [Chitinophagales bacterium]|nr:GH3 auxin-responsive promoter family protein [Chitinophagales bacterium]MBP8754392.1 GH3 auxin-responsive promoter family protein [Chitinophagales bacterium]MBP9189530.1 GH3 auxin-responsive promoter family protein [Chitinophagales bacterium]MBP9549788.1 GH3 auxin-responsive promoter family protein [Chitinophagales bacterium]MBP9704023.1 GH3 auxin-responsive promoter family protein [Chitinophagales bacterium]